MMQRNGVKRSPENDSSKNKAINEVARISSATLSLGFGLENSLNALFPGRARSDCE